MDNRLPSFIALAAYGANFVGEGELDGCQGSTKIEDHRFFRLSAARLEGAPGSGLFRVLGHKNAACRFRIFARIWTSLPPRKALSRGHGGVWRVFAPWRCHDPQELPPAVCGRF